MARHLDTILCAALGIVCGLAECLVSHVIRGESEEE